MSRLYPRAKELRASLRLVHAFYAVIIALGGGFLFLLTRGFHPQAAAKRNKPEIQHPCFPTTAHGDERAPDFFAVLRKFVEPANASTHLASFFPVARAASENATMVPTAYPSLAEFEARFDELARKFPQHVSKHLLGMSTQQRPLWALRVTDNPLLEEDEPALLFTALHHAREPAGVFICQAVIEELLAGYDQNARRRRIVDSLDLWFVPLVNPDGYEYLMTRQRQFPWWRKNLRDNNNDGKFDPLVDGVDLNRNYDYNWSEGGEGEFGSWFYRGQSAFSEPETQALRDLDAERNFVLGVSFHSYGEAVLYPWGNFNPAPDHALILDIAQNYAAQIGRQSGAGKYHVLPLNGRVGQSSVWRYGAAGAIDFICETGEDYFPRIEALPQLVAENTRGVFYLFERTLRSGIYGHVRDAETGAPLVAEIVIEGFESAYVKPRHSHPSRGRFERLLLPGVYALAVRKEGYHTARFANLSVNDSTLTRLEVELQREAARPSVTSH